MSGARLIGCCSVCGIVRAVLIPDHSMPVHAPINRARRRCSGSFLLPSLLWLAHEGKLLHYVDPRTGQPVEDDSFTAHIRRRRR